MTETSQMPAYCIESRAVTAVLKSVRATVDKRDTILPFLFFRDANGAVRLSEPCLHWAQASTGVMRSTKILSALSTWSRFLNFIGAFLAPDDIDGAELDYLLLSYLHCRHGGTASCDADDPVSDLRWEPVQYSTLSRETRELSTLIDHFKSHFGMVHDGLKSFEATDLDRASHRLLQLAALAERDFFAHLGAARLRWRSMEGQLLLKLPAAFRRPPIPSSARHVITTEEVWSVISAETNPCFRALWLAAAFGGPRISEQLNAWQIDIRDAADRSLFFRSSADFDASVLYLRTHPSWSCYVASAGASPETRKAYLARKYGLLPRNELSSRDPLYAGWKGTRPTGVALTHEVLWADFRAARLFEECAAEICSFHSRYRTSKLHPWFFVNIADRSGDHLGRPLKAKRVQKAFDAACRRVGIEPHEWGRNLHGLRHHYVHLLREVLQLSDRAIQIAMGHSNIQSQHEYDRQVRAVHQQVSRALSSDHLS